MCFEASGSINNTAYSYVGEGKGGYEIVNVYNYVGDGQGAFSKEQGGFEMVGGFRPKKACIGLFLIGACILAVAGTVCFLMAFAVGGTGHTAVGGVRRATGIGPTGADAQDYDCGDGLEDSWDAQKKAWCCANYGRGCPEFHGCDSLCIFSGASASCRDRVRWAAKHKFGGQSDACKSSYDVVLRQCSVCSACNFASLAGCTAGTPEVEVAVTAV